MHNSILNTNTGMNAYLVTVSEDPLDGVDVEKVVFDEFEFRGVDVDGHH